MGEPARPSDRPAAGAAAWAVAAAFGTYFCVYAFRKPFTAAAFADDPYWGAGYKTALVVAQVLGYTASKFLGIKVVSEVSPARRAGLILALVGVAELALLLFAVTPAPWNVAWLFVNGLPLGMTFGLVLGVLEGRRQSEALAAGLCASFVVADGVAKSAGAYLLREGVSEAWMPAAAGLLFAPALVVFVAMLARVPPPAESDVAVRSARAPMTAADRRAFVRRYAVGLLLLGAAYLLVTVLRSVRADFAPEVWAGLGVTGQPGVFTYSEMAVAACVLVLSGAAVLIRDNRRAFTYAMGTAAAGAVLLAAALVGLWAGVLSPLAFMVLHGVGLYLPYIAVHTTVFERLIAMTRDRGTVGYLMTLVDAFGYLGYVAVLLARAGGGGGPDFLAFFVPLSWVIAAATLALLLPAWYYFVSHPAAREA
ncbi:MAG: DUF5690 family protein [Gemmataceae bacterium]